MISLLLPRNLIFQTPLRLMLSVLFVSFCPRSLHAADTNAVAGSAADQAWKALQHLRETPPEPLKEIPDHMYSQKEIRDHYAMVAEEAAAVADKAKQFYTQYPDNPHAVTARDIYFNSLHTAVEMSSTNKIAELQAVTEERLKDPKLDEAARLKLSLRLLHSAVSGRQYEGNEAMRAELEKRARQLARDYPGHPDGLNFMLNMARAAAPEKSAALAREILAGTGDVKIRDECQGLIHRAEASGRPMALKLPLADGTVLDLDQMRGSVVCLLFWDSQGKFPAKALYAVNGLYKTYHPQGLEIWGLNFDEKKEAADRLLKEYKIAWPQYFDPAAGGKIKRQFGVSTLPMLWLVDKKGVLRELKVEREPDALIKKYLGE